MLYSPAVCWKILYIRDRCVYEKHGIGRPEQPAPRAMPASITWSLELDDLHRKTAQALPLEVRPKQLQRVFLPFEL